MDFSNALIHETSPYLLQHAHNPVQWYPWGEEALTLSRQQDKPILVSIGYAACHWCHVMERESFEDPQIAAFMNEHFINIKIDREERPDLDHIYMDAVQAIEGSGGWPLNVFLTTDAAPFSGGTYFPPQQAFNRNSWGNVLRYVVDAWQNKRDEVEEQAKTLLAHISQSSRFLSKKIDPDNLEKTAFVTVETCKEACNAILQSADLRQGGFGQAPKFPQTFTIRFLLAHSFFFHDEKALSHAEFSLQQLVNGGIYDQLAGGMARYSTDAEWLAPHFEKMLYDNALLVSALCDAYQITKKEFYKDSIHRTLRFFISEMKDAGGGFYAALDADSEGVEGKFYVWSKSEVQMLLGKDASLFCEFYDITDYGNWEHNNILRVKEPIEAFASRKQMNVKDVAVTLENGRSILLNHRKLRIAPATDDKIILGWNCLLLTSLCQAAACLGDKTYEGEARHLFDFLFEKFSENGEVIYHSYKNGKARHPAFLDDLAYLIQSCIWMQQLTGENEYLNKAAGITNLVFEHFFDPESGFFFFSGSGQTDVVVRKIELYDGAVPSGNSVMAENLFYLSIVFDRPEWKNIAISMLRSLTEVIKKYPTSFGVWANLMQQSVLGQREIVVTGRNSRLICQEILKVYLPGRVFQSSENNDSWPLLQNKIFDQTSQIYICKNRVCLPPVKDLSNFAKLIYE